MAVSRADVARRAGVSPSVVSYVINGGPRGVAPSTAARVRRAITELGYRPNGIASALRGGATRTVGFLGQASMDPWSVSVNRAVAAALLPLGYVLLSGFAEFNRATEDRYLQAFTDRRVDGLIVTSATYLRRIKQDHFDGRPIITLDDCGFARGATSVHAEPVKDARYAVAHLQRHGHTRIACVSTVSNPFLGSGHEHGWRAQQNARSYSAESGLLTRTESSLAGGRKAAMSLLRNGIGSHISAEIQPTAMFMSSIEQASGAIHACHTLGLRVPQDIAIVAAGSTRENSFSGLAVTAMREPVDAIAAAIVDYLRATFAGGQPKRADLGYTGNLVVARTCGCETPNGQNELSLMQ